MPIFAPQDFPGMFADFGEAVTFKRRGSASGVSVSALFDEGAFLGAMNIDADFTDATVYSGKGEYAVVFLRQDQISSRPAYQDKVVRGASEFTILQVKAEDGLWKCLAVADARVKF